MPGIRRTAPAAPGRSRTPTTDEPGASVTTRALVSGPAILKPSPDQIRSTQASGTTRTSPAVVVVRSHVQATKGEATSRSM